MTITFFNQNRQNGQALLVFILLSTILASIGLSIAQSTVQDSQISQLEAQSKMAFSAAESGIEAALSRGSDITEGTITFPGIKKMSALYVDNQTSNFSTPTIYNNKQFTFYLSGYNLADKTFGAPIPSSHLMEINPKDISLVSMCADATTTFALELTFINTETREIFRRLIDHCDIIDDSVDEWEFGVQNQISSLVGQDANILILRAIGDTTAFAGMKLTITNPSGAWPSQGSSIVSVAETTTGVVRQIRLFSSNPQMPSSLFVPSF